MTSSKSCTTPIGPDPHHGDFLAFWLCWFASTQAWAIYYTGTSVKFPTLYTPKSKLLISPRKQNRLQIDVQRPLSNLNPALSFKISPTKTKPLHYPHNSNPAPCGWQYRLGHPERGSWYLVQDHSIEKVWILRRDSQVDVFYLGVVVVVVVVAVGGGRIGYCYQVSRKFRKIWLVGLGTYRLCWRLALVDMPMEQKRFCLGTVGRSECVCQRHFSSVRCCNLLVWHLAVWYGMDLKAVK